MSEMNHHYYSPTTHHHHHHHHHHDATVSHHAPPKNNTKLLSIFLKFVVMSLILSFFLIFIGLAAILLLLAGSFIHRRRRHTTPPPPTSYPLLDLQHHLPAFPYSGDISKDCSICLEGFQDGEICRAIPICNHFFHAQCVDTWLMKVPNCPVCRRVVRLDNDWPVVMYDGDDDECRFLWAVGVGRQVLW